MDDAAAKGSLAWTVLAAAREAAAAQPKNSALQLRTAEASIRLKRVDLADLHVRRALALHSVHATDAALLAKQALDSGDILLAIDRLRSIIEAGDVGENADPAAIDS